MQLNETDRVWCPVEQPEYLCLLSERQQPPKTLEQFLLLQVDLFNRVLADASPKERDQANRRVQQNLPEEAQAFLPSDLVNDPTFPNALLLNPSVEGTRLQEWKQGFQQAVRQPLLPEQEAAPLLLQMSLETFLDRLL